MQPNHRIDYLNYSDGTPRFYLFFQIRFYFIVNYSISELGIYIELVHLKFNSTQYTLLQKFYVFMFKLCSLHTYFRHCKAVLKLQKTGLVEYIYYCIPEILILQFKKLPKSARSRFEAIITGVPFKRSLQTPSNDPFKPLQTIPSTLQTITF